MPTYTFNCLKCEKTFDMIVKMDDRDIQTCETCGTLLTRGITRPGMVWAPTAGGYR